MNLINCLKSTDFTDSEKSVVDYILANVEKTLSMTIYQLAEDSNSSTSTITRLCKKIQLKGFKEFKIRLSRDLELYYQNVRSIDANIPFAANDSDRMVAQKIAQLTCEVVMAAQSTLNDQVLKQAVDLMLQAKNIIGVGLSHSFIRLTDFQAKLLPINMHVRLIHLQAEQFYLANNATGEDVAIIVSYSGKTAEIVNEARIFAKNHTPIIAITSNSKSPLAKYATVVLTIPNIENLDFKVSNFSSQIAMEYVLNTLYSCIYKRNFSNNLENHKNGPTTKFAF